MKFFWNCAKLVFAIIVFTFVFSSCALRKIPDATYDDNAYYNRNSNGSYSPELGTPATEADSIARAVQGVRGINNAVVVIDGNTAYVGIDLNEHENIESTSEIQSIKEQVASVVRREDADIKTVYVSAETDFVEKITRISRELRNGKPIGSIRDDLDNIVKVVTPKRK